MLELIHIMNECIQSNVEDQFMLQLDYFSKTVPELVKPQ